MAAMHNSSNSELLELAMLHALGQLEPDDEALFDRAFDEASDADREQVKELQAAVVTDPAFLSPDLPGDGLRVKVLERVLLESRRRRPTAAPVIARIDRAGIAPGHRTRRVAHAFRSPLFWQAASFALLAGLVTSVIFNYKSVSVTQALIEGREHERMTQAQRAALDGADNWALLNRADVKIALGSVGRVAAGVLGFDERTKKVIVQLHGLERDGGEYVLRITDASGKVLCNHALVTSGDGVYGGAFELDATGAVIALARVEVYDARGTVLLYA